jgi:signal peptidase I
VHIYTIPSASMAPTLLAGDHIVVTRCVGAPRRGDVVVFRAPLQPDADYIKRIIGLPGESVVIRNGQVFIDGQRLDEPYIDFPATYEFPPGDQPLTVPDSSYFVLGDNRPDSSDSHLGWFVPADNLIGRAWLRYWPPSELGVFQPLGPAPSTSNLSTV